MADGQSEGEPSAQATPQPHLTIAKGFPPHGFEVLFADRISSISVAGGVVRIYFVRQDAEISGESQFRNTPVVQLIMPIESFAAATISFSKTLQEYVEKGILSKDHLNQIEAMVGAVTSKFTK